MFHMKASTSFATNPLCLVTPFVVLTLATTSFAFTTRISPPSKVVYNSIGNLKKNINNLRIGIHGKGILYSTSTNTDNYGDTDLILPSFDSEDEYIGYLRKVATLPKGFVIGTADGTFVPPEAPLMGDLPIRGTVIYLPDGPTDAWAAVFTKNKFPGAPIIIGRDRLSSGEPLQAIVINNKVSNVCSGGDGVGNAELVCKAVANGLSLSGGYRSVLPASTGVIGWRLPASELAEQVVPKAIDTMIQTTDKLNSALDAAKYIMTTDRYPKIRSKTLSNGSRIVGIAKGAGMIEPNMATMLGYIMTDVSGIGKDALQSMLSDAVNKSFNSMSIDGAESTSDEVILLSSNQHTEGGTVDVNEFQQALDEICYGLSSDIVRNGEGTGHVLKINVMNYPGSDADARFLGRHVVNSPLFKCAVSGNDPNTGRLAGAIGSWVGRFAEVAPIGKMSLALGGRTIFNAGKFVLEGDEIEKELSDYMLNAQLDEHGTYPQHQKYVEIDIDFGDGVGNGKAVVLGSDLTAEYVSVNADYRS